ncbi:MAG: hypothetical protein NC131_20305 [Roseburia sp.]|nr:hypothetical protein [Roseburia sp.]
MEFLDKETEKLLKECLDRESDFPKVLSEKLGEASPSEVTRLRGQIGILSKQEYIKINWADNLPYLGKIEQKGYVYFHNKEVYIRAKLRQDPFFSLLDGESENVLYSLLLDSIEAGDEQLLRVDGRMFSLQVLEYLIESGYLKLEGKLYKTLQGGFNAFVSLTQKGKLYFDEKEKRIEEILLLGEEALVVNNIEKQFNNSFNGASISDSQVQIGDNNTQNINFAECEEQLKDLRNEIESLKLTDEQQKQIVELIEVATQSCKMKKSSLVKSALKEIWDFAKATGSGLLATFLSMKFGF